jgi:hypothetical protein
VLQVSPNPPPSFSLLAEFVRSFVKDRVDSILMIGDCGGQARFAFAFGPRRHFGHSKKAALIFCFENSNFDIVLELAILI